MSGTEIVIYFICGFGVMGYGSTKVCPLKFSLYMSLGCLIIGIALFKIISLEQKNIHDFDAKCRSEGGQTLEYSAYHQETQLSCVKKDSIIDIR